MNNSVSEHARFETKFVTRPTNLSSLQSWLKLHEADFYKPHEDRWVNNVYFDTYDYSSFSENLSGISDRCKLRYRWYGKSDLPDAGNLEVKIKRNVFGWKKRFEFTESPAPEGTSWRKLTSAFSRQMGSEARMWLDSRPFPILINRYYRRYFVTRDELVRVTLDSDQCVFDQRYSSRPNTSRKAHIPDALIVEFKCAREHRNLTSDIIQGLPIRVSKHSKYVVGVQSIHRY